MGSCVVGARCCVCDFVSFMYSLMCCVWSDSQLCVVVFGVIDSCFYRSVCYVYTFV